MEKLIEELTLKINSIIDRAKAEERLLTAEEEKELAIYSAKLDVLKKFTPKSMIAPVVMSEQKLHDFGVKKTYTSKEEIQNEISGLFWLFVLKNDKKSQERLESDFGIKMALGGSNTPGSYTVPRDMMKRIIELFAEYGVIRKNAFVYPLGTVNTDIPIGSTLVTANYVDENSSITAADPSLSQVTLTPKKLVCMTLISRELEQDQVVGLGDYINRLFARSMAYKEDDTGFNGDGSSGYGGFTGLKSALLAGSIYQGTAKKFVDMTLTDFEQVIGKCPTRALKNAKWYVSPTGWALGMLKLGAAASGNTVDTIANGMVKMFLGYPVEIVEVLPAGTADATNTILVYFGDMTQSLLFGDRMQIEIAISEDRYFEFNQIAIRAIERIAFRVFDPGTSSLPGGVVAYKTAAAA